LPRLTKKRVALFLALVILAVAGAVAGGWLWKETRSKEVLGSSTVEFRPGDSPEKKRRPAQIVKREPWPTYGYSLERAHVSPFNHRPPFKRLWVRTARHYLEYPPAIAYGRIFLPQQKGRFFAVNPQTGGILWSKSYRRCAPSSPTVSDGVVYQAFMHPLPCRKHQRGATGLMVAMHPLNGKEFWRFRAGAIESSPLIVKNRIYFGSWDRNVYALNKKTGKQIWEFRTDNRIVAAPAYSGGTIFIGTNGGHLYALNAKTGRLQWRAASNTRLGRREYFYATPTIAYGRVYAANTDGYVYSYGARSGRLLWAQRAGTYVYTAPAVWRKTVYVGTFDGFVVAFDAATGRSRWRYDAPGSIIGAPTVMGGLIYFSICGTCGSNASRRVEFGRPKTFALDARRGRLVWTFPDGKYSPIVADRQRVYLVGRTRLYAFKPRKQTVR
jgi:outer membrane protein assembly factor BamB